MSKHFGSRLPIMNLFELLINIFYIHMYINFSTISAIIVSNFHRFKTISTTYKIFFCFYKIIPIFSIFYFIFTISRIFTTLWHFIFFLILYQCTLFLFCFFFHFSTFYHFINFSSVLNNIRVFRHFYQIGF